MSDSRSSSPGAPTTAVSCIGLVVHPSRDVHDPVDAVRDWADKHDAELVQIPFAGAQRELFEERDPEDCDVVLAIGGDGTTLAAIHAAAHVDRPILGVACGSLGALTSVPADEIAGALDRFQAGDWTARRIPALEVACQGTDDFTAFNDLVVVRAGDGQLKISAQVDGALFARLAGDGCIISTPVGSSAYTIAAGGPLLDPGLHAIVLTSLPTHGGFCPPLVIAPDSQLELDIVTGHGGGRIEVDGRGRPDLPEKLSIRLRPDAATVITFDAEESHLTGLRERGIIMDSPRILADDKRARD
jgi:NAD+ kinase